MLEFLLINHPLDCPVCDRGGECPLQDQTLAFGPGESRFVEEKRHFEKPIPISDLVLLDRERCIQCGRCTRFAAEVAGDPLIDFGGRGGDTEVITYPDEPFSSYFSGNTVQICPVGALTASAYRFRARPVGPRRRSRRRARRARSAAAARCRARRTGSCACSASTPSRSTRAGCATRAATATSGCTPPTACARRWCARPASWSRRRGPRRSTPRPPGCSARSTPTVPASIARARRRARHQRGRVRVGAVRQGRARHRQRRRAARRRPAGRSRARPAGRHDRRPRPAPAAIVLLGPDLKEELPVLYLRVRRAAVDSACPSSRSRRARPGSRATSSAVLRHAPGRGRRDGRAVAGARRRRRHRIRCTADRDGGRARSTAARATVVVDARPAVGRRVGRRGRARPRPRSPALPDVRFLSALRRGNVHGALDLGLAPGLPARAGHPRRRRATTSPSAWGAVPRSAGSTPPASSRPRPPAAIDTLVLLGADPLADFPDRIRVRAALAAVPVRGRGRRVRRRRRRARRRVAPRPVWGEKAGHGDQPRGPGAAPRAQGHARAAPRWTTGASRRARAALRHRLRPRAPSTRCRTRSPGSPPRTPASTPRCVRRARDGVVLPDRRATPTRSCSGRRRAHAGVSWEPIARRRAEPHSRRWHRRGRRRPTRSPDRAARRREASATRPPRPRCSRAACAARLGRRGPPPVPTPPDAYSSPPRGRPHALRRRPHVVVVARRSPASPPGAVLSCTRATSTASAWRRGRRGARHHAPRHRRDRRARRRRHRARAPRSWPSPSAARRRRATSSTRRARHRPARGDASDDAPCASARAHRPAVQRRHRHHRRADRHRQDDRGLRAAAALGAVLHLVPAQGHRRHAEPHRSRPRRALRPAPDPRRRHQAVLQGAVGARHAPTAVFKLAPYLAIIPAFLAFCDRARSAASSPIAGHQTYLQLADPPFGVLWLLAMSGIGLYGVMLAGWSSGSKYPLLGSVRASAQLLSYEAAFGLAIVGVLVQPDTLSTARHRQPAGVGRRRLDLQRRLVLAAGDRRLRDLRHRRGRRDQPPAVRPRRGRAGARRRVPHRVHRHPVRDLLPRRVHEPHHHVGDRGHAVLRWPAGPGLGFLAADSWFNVWVMPVFWFMLKVLVLLFATVWLRATLPRLRYDQLMGLGWKYLIEIAFLWVMVSAVVVVAKEEGWTDVDRRCPRRSSAPLVLGGILCARDAPPGEARRGDPLMGWLERVRRHVPPDRASEGHRASTRRRSARSRCASTVATSSTATRTAWRSASAASCARACARRSASTCAAPTTRPTRRSRRASATGSSTRSTTSAASTATCASRRAPPRRSPRPSCSSSRSPTASDAIYTKAELVVGDDGRARRQPWELWLGDEDDHTSAWMRATAPAGKARLRGPGRLVGRARLRRARARGGAVGRPSPRPLTAAAPAEPVATSTPSTAPATPEHDTAGTD